MKTALKTLPFLLLFIFVFQFTARSEEIVTDVMIVLKADKILAFSGSSNKWIPRDLRLKEKVHSKKAHGNVGVVATSERLFGFSAVTGRWHVIHLQINEEIKELQAEGNVATVKTDRRIFGFNAMTGEWVEAD